MIRPTMCSGLCTTPPYNPECRSRAGPLTVTSASMMPRAAYMIVGSSGREPPSETSMKSAWSRSRCSRMNGSMLGEPISSSPSKNTLTLTGSRPSAASIASKALRLIHTPHLSSTAPRAYSRPSRMDGSKGGVTHSSSGSTGCTS